MISTASLLILAIVLGIVAIGYCTSVRMTEEKNKFFLSRKSRSLAELYDEYFIENEISFEEFGKLWNQIAGELEVPPDKLLPSDRFDYELLTPTRTFQLNNVDCLRSFYVQEWKRRNLPLPPKNIQSLRELVCTLSSKPQWPSLKR